MIPSPAVSGPLTIRYLSRANVEAAGVTIGEVIDAVQTGFLEKGNGRVEMPPKPGVHPGEGDNFIHAMPASIPGLDAVGIKWISGYPDNQARGLPYITGLLILNDPATGVPISVMDATWITGVRTAAASAVSARHLARPESSVLAILACGVQGTFHVDALRAVLPALTTIRAYDPDPGRVAAFAAGVHSRHGIDVTIARDAETAVRGADVIVTSGPILRTPHASIKAGWMAPGAFASAVDFDSYWDAAALRELDRRNAGRDRERRIERLRIDQPVPVGTVGGDLRAGLVRRALPRPRLERGILARVVPVAVGRDDEDQSPRAAGQLVDDPGQAGDRAVDDDRLASARIADQAHVRLQRPDRADDELHARRASPVRLRASP